MACALTSFLPLAFASSIAPFRTKNAYSERSSVSSSAAKGSIATFGRFLSACSSVSQWMPVSRMASSEGAKSCRRRSSIMLRASALGITLRMMWISESPFGSLRVGKRFCAALKTSAARTSRGSCLVRGSFFSAARPANELAKVSLRNGPASDKNNSAKLASSWRSAAAPSAVTGNCITSPRYFARSPLSSYVSASPSWL